MTSHINKIIKIILFWLEKSEIKTEYQVLSFSCKTYVDQTSFPNLLHKTLDTRQEHSHCANMNIKASKIKVHFDGIFVRKVKIVSVNAFFACFKNQMYGSIEANRFNVCSLIIEHMNKERKWTEKKIIFESITFINKIIHILYNIYLLCALCAIPLDFSVRYMKCIDEYL